MTLDIQPVTKADLPIVEQLAYNYELYPQETRREEVLNAQLAKLSN